MPDKSTKSWESIRSENPVNEKSVAAYKRVMDAEQLIADARYRRGVSHVAITDALAVSEPENLDIERECDLFVSIVGRFVEALGGHLEVIAVFPDETITVLRESDHHSGSTRS
ncbi:MAG: hypothetical protein M3071_07250 [Actinomycetota bacterium]|nr:hypothetical protein [Actinomycetota bacterium]